MARKGTPKVRAPFALNSDARKVLALQRAYRETRAALDAATAVENAGKSPRERSKCEYSPATRAIRDKWAKASGEADRFGETLAERTRARIEAGKPMTLADVLTAAIAGYHSVAAERATAEAVRYVSGLGAALEG